VAEVPLQVRVLEELAEVEMVEVILVRQQLQEQLILVLVVVVLQLMLL
jgi:hypothetical protein